MKKSKNLNGTQPNTQWQIRHGETGHLIWKDLIILLRLKMRSIEIRELSC